MKRLRALRDDPARRRDEGVFVAEGIHLAEEALRAGVPIETAIVAPSLDDRRLREALARRAARFEEGPDDLVASLQDARGAQPVLLIVGSAPIPRREGPDLLAVAVGVQDPGNLGALARSADAAGATELIACGGADLHHPRAVRATMGAIFRLPCSRGAWEEVSATLAAAGTVRVGADPGGAEDYSRFDWNRPVALVLGGEGAGLSRIPREDLDATVRVPMHAGAESLSVAAAAAVLLFEAARARRLRRDG